MTECPQKPAGRRLTRRQRKWAMEYMVSGNASEAARKAGYGARERGVENISKRIVEKFLEELGELGKPMEEVGPDQLYAKAIEMMNDCKQEGTKARCLELAMRCQGMFKETLDINTNGDDTSKLMDRLKALDPALYAMMAERMGATEH